MQAIVTKYLPPTAARNARIKATCAAGSITVPYDHGTSGNANHRATAQELIAKLQWTDSAYGVLVTGCMPNGDGVHVLTCRDGEGDWR